MRMFGIFLLLVGFVGGLRSSGAIPAVDAEHAGILGDWLLVGPWSAPQGKKALGFDFLKPFGLGETQLAASALEKWVQDGRFASEQIHLVKGKECVDFGSAFRFFPSVEDAENAGYAACVIHCEKDREAWLLFGYDAQVSMWLNGQQIYLRPDRRNLKEYDDAIPLALRQGDNLLLIKLVNVGRAWIMNARLEPTRDDAVKTAFSLTDGFFLKALVAPGKPLEMFVRGMPESVVFDAQIETFGGKTIRSVRFGPKLPVPTEGLPVGLYRLARSEGGPWSRPAFYVGDYESLFRKMSDRCSNVSDDRVLINVHAYLRRLEVLKDAIRIANSRPDDMEWSRRAMVEDPEHKAVYAAVALEEILSKLERGEEPFRNVSGLHLRGFRSKIDDQPMYYRVFVPSSYKADTGPGVPLFIMPQPVISTNRPFLESAFVARQREAEDWARVAERLGVAILWPGYRVSPYGNPIDFAHFEEALAAVRSDYRIDPTRIYLHGYCSTGLFSSMEALRHPQRYAAIAMVNPVLRRLKGRYDERDDFPRNASYRAWLRETDPMESFDLLKNIPICLMHDELDSDHGPLSHSVELVNNLRAIGGRIQFDHYRVPADRPIRTRLVQEQLDWLCKQRRADASDRLSISAGPLSVADSLAERFVVVRPTGGGAAAQRWCSDFEAAWQRMTFVPCRVVDDTQLKAEDEAQSNIVLIGNAEANRAWIRIIGDLPIKMAPDSIDVAGRHYQGQGLSVQCVFAHPKFPNRKIVVIGSLDSKAGFGTQELAVDGWFNYAIWETKAGKTTLMAAERAHGSEITGNPSTN